MSTKAVPYHRHRAGTNRVSVKTRMKMVVGCYERQAAEVKITLTKAPWEDDNMEVTSSDGFKTETDTR